MNIEIFKSPDPSGKLSKESFVSKNYPEEYKYIIEFCEFNSLQDLPFKQKVHHAINTIINKNTCKNPSCNKQTNYKNSTIGYYEYCSNKCISSDPNIKKSKEEKSFQKFGTKAPAQSIEIKDKIIKTNNEKYGDNSPMSNSEIKNKSKLTLYKNHGVDNPAKSSEIIKKRVESFKKNISQYKESYKNTSLEKYGVEHPWMKSEIHSKTIDHFYKDYRERILFKLESRYKFVEFRYKPTELEIHCPDCNDNFIINPTQFYYRVENSKNTLCTNCYPISDNSSLLQIELLSFIKEHYNENITTNDRKVINPYEIDIYLPDMKVGFEFNGIYWHSILHKTKEYHHKKWERSIKEDVNIFTVWEDDWILKENIVKSFILNKIHKTPNRVFARKCRVVEISYKDSAKFLNENHLQGDCKSSIRLGLFFNDELVSLMTFSKLRLPLSQKAKANTYELTRFCNKVYNNIIGGASKLFKYFQKNYEFSEVHTYSDNLISNGSLYKTLGFEFQHISRPGYWYVVNEKREHRFNYRKHKLVSMGFDKNKTEEQIMLDSGFFRIYNAGNRKWILCNNFMGI